MNPAPPQMTDVTGLGVIALALAALAVIGVGAVARRPSRAHRAIGLALVAVLLLVPIGALSAAEYVRGLTGDLSVTTLLLLMAAAFGPTLGRARDRPGSGLMVQLSLVVAAAALYPMALGVGPFDPYRLGYGSPWLLGALGLGALAAWLGRFPLIAFGLGAAVAAWALRGYESSNLWDYLIDPFAALYAVVALLVRGCAWVWRAAGRRAETGRVPAAKAGGIA